MRTNEAARKLFVTVFLSPLLIAFLCSCSNQSSSSKSENDPTFRLNFSTGIRSIFEDRKGNYWFGSHQEGVCRFDGKKFTYFTTEDGLSNNQIRTIQEDQDGKIWFGTGHEICSFDGNSFVVQTGQDQLIQSSSWEDEWSSGENLWFQGDNVSGVYRYDGKKLSYFALPVPQDSDPGNPYFVTGIVQGKNGMVWVGTYPAVIGYDGESFTIIDDESLGFGLNGTQLHVRSIFEDSTGNLWIGNNGLGVLFYDGKSVVNFTEENGLGINEMGPIGSLGRIFSIAEDSAGNIWFGTRDNGAWRYDGKSLTNFTQNDGLTSLMVWAIYRDNNNDLLFGMNDGSVCKFNGKSFDRIF